MSSIWLNDIGPAEEALAQARKLVQRRPVPAEHLSLLAAAQAKAGDTSAGLVTIQQSARRGWRDRQAQETMLRLALSAGDDREAARRLAAIWALAGSDEDLAELAPLVLAKPAAREEMARLLATEPKWNNAFLQRGPRVLTQDQFGEIAELARTRGANLDR